MRPIDADAALKALRKCQTYLYDALDPELKIKLSSAKAAINNLPTIQPEKEQLSCGGTTSDLISRQAAIDALMPIYKSASLRNRNVFSTARKCMAAIEDLPSAQPEPLTDKEQRIFLAAMGREEKVCRQVDDECRDCREPYEDSLVRVCHEIIRKVKATLWET